MFSFGYIESISRSGPHSLNSDYVFLWRLDTTAFGVCTALQHFGGLCKSKRIIMHPGLYEFHLQPLVTRDNMGSLGFQGGGNVIKLHAEGSKWHLICLEAGAKGQFGSRGCQAWRSFDMKILSY